MSTSRNLWRNFLVRGNFNLVVYVIICSEPGNSNLFVVSVILILCPKFEYFNLAEVEYLNLIFFVLPVCAKTGYLNLPVLVIPLRAKASYINLLVFIILMCAKAGYFNLLVIPMCARVLNYNLFGLVIYMYDIVNFRFKKAVFRTVSHLSYTHFYFFKYSIFHIVLRLYILKDLRTFVIFEIETFKQIFVLGSVCFSDTFNFCKDQLSLIYDYKLYKKWILPKYFIGIIIEYVLTQLGIFYVYNFCSIYSVYLVTREGRHLCCCFFMRNITWFSVDLITVGLPTESP